MAEAAEVTFVDRFNGYSRQPMTRQLALLLGLAASIAMAIGLVQWAMEPNYKPLFGSMAPEDMNPVITTLEANAIDYSLNQRTGMIAVPAGDVHRARMLLASAGYPKGDGVGFESLYQEQEIGLSSFMEQARFHRALEAELSRTISAMDSIRGARVHLAMARQSAFLRQREKPAASVMLNLYAGRALNDRQLAGIVHLVASSVPNLEAQQVSVVDQQGKLLSSQGSDDDMAFSQDQFRHRRELEEDYSQRILGILEPILGAGSVRAQVAADMDFTRIERTSEVYAPEATVRSEQTSEETSNQRTAGGVPGTLSNEPPLDAGLVAEPAGAAPAQAPQAATPARTSRRSTVNYEIDKTISHILETPGSLQRLSIAVVVDYIENTAEDGTVTREPMAQERIDEITTLVREAVGFDAARGDTVSVISASFVEAPPIEDIVVETSIFEQDWIWQLGKGLLALIVLLTLIFTVLRPVMKFSAAPAPVIAAPQGLPAGEVAGALGNDGAEMGEDQLTLGSDQADGNGEPDYQQQLQMARTVASGEPERAAYVVKNWVADDG